MNSIWKIWDAQTNDRWEAYVELNNLYLSIERGQDRMTITNSNRLRVLAQKAYGRTDPFIDWWQNEFTKLPGWYDV